MFSSSRVSMATTLLTLRAASPLALARFKNKAGVGISISRTPFLPTSVSIAVASVSPVASLVISEARTTARYKSTIAVPSRSDNNSNSAAATDEKKFAQWDGLSNGKTPTLNHVRSLPFIGSAIPALCGTPNIDPVTHSYEYWKAMRDQNGEFYTMGYLLGGKKGDIFKRSYVINDPREYIKIIRAGGKYPSGFVGAMWPTIRWCRERGVGIGKSIHGRGEEWRRARTFFQTDLLSPDAARGYIPGITRAASLASKGAQAAAIMQSCGEDQDALKSYLNRCAFDMFSSMMFGIYTETADMTTPTDQEDDAFVRGSEQGLGTAIEILFSPYEFIVGNLLKFETSAIKHSFEGIDTAWATAQEKCNQFIERKERGELSENEVVSYFARALDRQKLEGSNVSVEEVMQLTFIGLFVAVDTTSAVLGWNLFHIARCPEVQEKLYNEVSSSVESVGNGKLTTEVLGRSNAPYLHAVIRESHRLTPANSIGIGRTVDVDNLEIHSHKMEKGDVVLLESYSQGMNPDLVDDPDEYRPERWLKEAVGERKGTLREVIDHPFLATPFSQGARKCPGSRVATNEIMVMLAHLILDWKITSPVKDLKDVQYQQRTVLQANLPNLHFEQRR